MGSVPADVGTIHVDVGSVRVDVGTVAVDAGSVPIDAGSVTGPGGGVAGPGGGIARPAASHARSHTARLPCGSPMAAGRSGPDAYNHPAGERTNPLHTLAGPPVADQCHPPVCDSPGAV